MDGLKEFIDLVEDEGVGLSLSCPFHPENDVYYPLEDRFKLKRNRYKCKLCNTNSRSEEEVYNHILLQHPQVLDDHVGFIIIWWIL